MNAATSGMESLHPIIGSEMPDKYYIDAYNILHKSPLLRPLAREDFESAREALVDKVAAFCAATGKLAVVVFDGQGRHHPEQVSHNRGVAGLQVLYSPTNLSADAVIERSVYQEKNRLEVVVVSNDRGLRELCAGMGALVMEAGHFIATMREARGDTSATAANTRLGEPLQHLEDRLDSETRGRLEALRETLKPPTKEKRRPS